MIVLRGTAPRTTGQEEDAPVGKVDRRRQPRSMEVRAKISATMKGRPVPGPSREKIRETMKLKGIKPPVWRGGSRSKRAHKAGLAMALLQLTPL